MNDEHQLRDRILDIFRVFDVHTNEFLPTQSLLGNIWRWPKEDQARADEVVEAMIGQGLLEPMEYPPGLRLTEEGYRLAHER